MEEIQWKFEPGDRVVVLSENAYAGQDFDGATGTVLFGRKGRWIGYLPAPTQLYSVRLDSLVDDGDVWPFTADELVKRIT